MPVPNPATSNNNSELLGVTAIATDDVWAVGYGSNTSTGWSTLVEHWNGATLAYRWNGASWIGSATLGPTGHDGFQVVVAIGSGDVRAVGTTSAASTLTEHFDGTSWSQATSASPGNQGDVLAAAAAAASTDVWAVGSSINYANGTFTRSTLIERFTG